MENFICQYFTEFKQLSTLKVPIVFFLFHNYELLHICSNYSAISVCMEAMGLPNTISFPVYCGPLETSAILI